MITLNLFAAALTSVTLHNPLAQPEAIQFDLDEMQQQIELQIDTRVTEMQQQIDEMSDADTLLIAQRGQEVKAARTE